MKTTEPTPEIIRERLNACGLKATPQRVQVYAAMCALGHAGADAVYRHLSDAGGRMTLATVYNVLESLAGAGLLVLRPNLGGRMCFDVNTEPHCHLCLQDGQSAALSDYRDDALLRAVESRVRSSLPEDLELDRVEIQILCHKKDKS